MSYQEKKIMKSKPSNSLNEANLRQFVVGQNMNESGDENEDDNMQRSVTSNTPTQSEVKRSKTNNPNNNQQDLSMTMDSIKVDSDKITFVSEKDFKFEKNCWVCKIQFGKINERQHHCRLCSHSVCKVCSTKKVNDQRVCDICFLKMKNVKGEKRKKKLLAAMKNFIKNLSANIKKGGEEYKKLYSKNVNLREQCQQQEINRQEELNSLQLKLAQIEASKTKQESDQRKLELDLTTKKLEKQNQLDIQNELEIRRKNIQNDIMLSNESYKSRLDQFKQLCQQKKDLQVQESFLRLPNYERAKRNDPGNICEALIFLDSNDRNNGINHYNTVSNANVIQSTIDSTSEINNQNTPNKNKNTQRSQIKSDYASSYNQGIMEDTEIIKHNSRSGKKNKNGKTNGGTSCLCD